MRVTQLDIPSGVIDFGAGQPSLSLLPLSIMRRAASHRLGQADPAPLQYGTEQGDGYFRLALAQFLREKYGAAVDPAHLLVTTGVSQGLDLICTLFTRAGDTVFVEEPSYFLALKIFADHRLNVVSLPMDEQGLIVTAVAEKLRTTRPVFVYTVPTFHNPAGVTMSADRRQQLVTLSQEYGFFIVADEVYHLLDYTALPPAPFAGYVPQVESVLSLGSFSKILAPGLRVGWLQAAPAWLERFTTCGLLDSGGGLNPFTSSLVRSVLEQGWQDEYLSHLKTVYRRRLEVLSEALRQQLGSVATFTEPAGGFFIWLCLPETLDTAALLPQARALQVGYRPGVKFSSLGGLRHWARLSFAFYEEAQLAEGVSRLARLFGRSK